MEQWMPSKECVEQFELVRKMGLCNMVDYKCVNTEAWLNGYEELADLNRQEYRILLKLYDSLVDHYGLERA